MQTQKLFNNFAIVSILFTALWYAAPQVSENTMGLVALVVIFILGMPHGALDIIMLKTLSRASACKSVVSWGEGKPGRRLASLVTFYSLVVVAAFSAWVIMPTLCLVAFLIIGAAHFRHDWQQTFTIPSWCFGLIVVTAPSLLYSSQLEGVFGWLFVPARHSVVIVLMMQVVTFICAVAVSYYWLKGKVETRKVGNTFMLLACASLLPPLIYFTIYFCVIHSVYHTVLIKNKMDMRWQELLAVTLLPMVGTLVLYAFAHIYLSDLNGLANYYPLIFIGLFAVTVPHVMLTYFCERFLGNVSGNVAHSISS